MGSTKVREKTKKAAGATKARKANVGQKEGSPEGNSAGDPQTSALPWTESHVRTGVGAQETDGLTAATVTNQAAVIPFFVPECRQASPDPVRGLSRPSAANTRLSRPSLR